MKKKLNNLFTNVLTLLFYLVFTVVPVTILIGCIKLIVLFFS